MNAAGDVIYDGVNCHYDNESRLCAVQTDNAVTGGTVATGYLYDAEGRRIAKGAITAMTNPLPTSSSPLSASMCNPATNGFAPTETYVLGQSGEQLSTYSWSGPAGKQTSTWVRTNVYGADGLLATYDVDGQGQPALHFLLTDQVGTRRMQTNPAGTPESECQSLPYGDGLNCFAAPNAPGTADQANALYFTGKQRDAESGGGSAYSGNDYFGARYYASSMGRFISPDPSGLYYANPYNPQSLNLYSYALNNPLVNTDPTGMECVWDDGSYDASDDAVTGNAEGCSGQGGTYVDPHLFENATLTNGQQSNTQPGDWSPNANSTIAQSWTNASATVNSGPGVPLSGTFDFGSMTQGQFISMMQQSGIRVSVFDTVLGLHPGLNLRGNQSNCSIHVILAPFAGQYGNPATGSFHIDEYNPLTFEPPASGSPLDINGGGMQPTSNIGPHVTQDVIPDLKIQAGMGTWTGNQTALSSNRTNLVAAQIGQSDIWVQEYRSGLRKRQKRLLCGILGLVFTIAISV
jgi:RHS repeat-associated protein